MATFQDLVEQILSLPAGSQVVVTTPTEDFRVDPSLIGGGSTSSEVFQRFTDTLTAQGEVTNFDFTGIANPISQKDIIDSLYEKRTDATGNVIFQIGRYADSGITDISGIGAIQRANNGNIYIFPNTTGYGSGILFIQRFDPTTGIYTNVGADLGTANLGSQARCYTAHNTTDDGILFHSFTATAGIYFDCNTETWVNTPTYANACEADVPIYNPLNNAFYIATRIRAGLKGINRYNPVGNTVQAVGAQQTLGGGVQEFPTGIQASNGLIYFKGNPFNSATYGGVVQIDPSTDTVTQINMNTGNVGMGRFPLELGGEVFFGTLDNNVSSTDQIDKFDIPPTTFTQGSASGIDAGFTGGFLALSDGRYLPLPQQIGGRDTLANTNFTNNNKQLAIVDLSTQTYEANILPSEDFLIRNNCITQDPLTGDWYAFGRQLSNGDTEYKMYRFVDGFQLDPVTNPELVGGILQYTEGIAPVQLKKIQVNVDYSLTYNEDGSGNITSVDIEKLLANGSSELFYNIGTSNGFAP